MLLSFIIIPQKLKRYKGSKGAILGGLIGASAATPGARGLYYPLATY